jgi:hypothetical protein
VVFHAHRLVKCVAPVFCTLACCAAHLARPSFRGYWSPDQQPPPSQPLLVMPTLGGISSGRFCSLQGGPLIPSLGGPVLPKPGWWPRLSRGRGGYSACSMMCPQYATEPTTPKGLTSNTDTDNRPTQPRRGLNHPILLHRC